MPQHWDFPFSLAFGSVCCYKHYTCLFPGVHACLPARSQRYPWQVHWGRVAQYILPQLIAPFQLMIQFIPVPPSKPDVGSYGETSFGKTVTFTCTWARPDSRVSRAGAPEQTDLDSGPSSVTLRALLSSLKHCSLDLKWHTVVCALKAQLWACDASGRWWSL